MKEHGLGVDVIINDIKSNPCCTHGPTVLFERFQGNGISTRYYACSACRDRRDCQFYHLVDQKYTEAKKEAWESVIKEANAKWKHKDIFNRSKTIKKLPALKRAYCLTCSLFIGADKRGGHKNCTLKTPLFDSTLLQPSSFLPPRENSKFEAQFMFSPSSVEVIMGMLGQLKAEKVLCLGTPKIFETILNSPEKNMSGLLMDIDCRYGAFFSPSQFLRYNMFNHHFFDGGEAKKTYQQFITGSEKLVIVSDPPFGGRMELLAHNILTLEKEWRTANKLPEDKHLSVLFIFPYFMEPQVLEQLPGFAMLDYQVDYDNHPLYSSGPKGMINGSAIRVFVNDRPSLFAMPANKGYRLCNICDRWVRSTNIHCEKCNGCMSKDGRTYKHCDDCKKCVKPSWKHCSGCQKCQPQDHKCSSEDAAGAPGFLCHSCGKEGHKRAECPDRKRSLSVSGNEAKNKKRKLDVNTENGGQNLGVNNKKKNKKNKNSLTNETNNNNHHDTKITMSNGKNVQNGFTAKNDKNAVSTGKHLASPKNVKQEINGKKNSKANKKGLANLKKVHSPNKKLSSGPLKQSPGQKKNKKKKANLNK